MKSSLDRAEGVASLLEAYARSGLEVLAPGEEEARECAQAALFYSPKGGSPLVRRRGLPERRAGMRLASLLLERPLPVAFALSAAINALAALSAPRLYLALAAALGM
jgi:hypothetical protein